MTKFRLIIALLMATFSYEISFAQCISGATKLCPGDIENFSIGPATNCIETASCSGLVSEYLVISYPDTTVISSLQTPSLNAADFSGCINVIPICYDLTAIQNFVQDLHDSAVPFLPSCCDAVNGETPAGVSPPICDAITALYPSGSDIQNLSDVLAILGAFGIESITKDAFVAFIEGINAQADLLGFVCTNSSVIAYCLDPVNFNNNAYQIVPASVVLTGTAVSSIETAANDILSTATIPTGVNVTYKAGVEILLDAGFTVDGEFLGEIEPCN